VFQNTVAGNVRRDLTYRFIGMLDSDELCCWFQHSLIGRDSSVGIASHSLRAGQFGVRTPNCPARPGAHPSFYSTDTGSLSRGLDHPPSSSAEVREKV
jgi:hypothetical protein